MIQVSNVDHKVNISGENDDHPHLRRVQGLYLFGGPGIYMNNQTIRLRKDLLDGFVLRERTHQAEVEDPLQRIHVEHSPRST